MRDDVMGSADWPMLDSEYFGNVQFELKYKGKTQCFPWLFVDFGTAVQTARSVKFECGSLGESPKWSLPSSSKQTVKVPR